MKIEITGLVLDSMISLLSVISDKLCICALIRETPRLLLQQHIEWCDLVFVQPRELIFPQAVVLSTVI